MIDTSPDAQRLRADLASLTTRVGGRDHRLIIDEVGGRFARVSEHLWTLLQRGEGDRETWRQAESAGWTRSRSAPPKRRFSPLAFGIPLGSVDRLAAWLAPRTNWLFGPRAIAFWCLVITMAGVLAIARHGEWLHSLHRLPSYLGELHPVSLVMVFALTKALHELSHAVVCRRVGARCGGVGVLVLCGMPCPYVDVTDVWRVSRTSSRCLVMLAGIYSELVIASLAFLVWLVSYDPAWQLACVYVMLVCGVSTLVFNANPLMRYDGYHVLCDLVGSTNLRGEARGAWVRFVSEWLRGPAARHPAGDRPPLRLGARALGLVVYHLAASAYRYFVLFAIASLLIAVAAHVHLAPLARIAVMGAAGVLVCRAAGRLMSMVFGRGEWRTSSPWRRCAVGFMVTLVIITVLFVPTPRYRSVEGFIEASDAVTVYLPTGGLIRAVDAEVGDAVEEGSRLVSILDLDATLETVRREGQWRLAALRREASERQALDRPDAAAQWEVLRATESASLESVRSARQRERQSEVLAPVAGVVLAARRSDPEAIPLEALPFTARIQGASSTVGDRLISRVGLGARRDGAWCRISAQRARHVELAIDAADRDRIRAGTPVTIRENLAGDVIHASRIASLSPIDRDSGSVTERATYRATCPMPTVDDAAFLRSIGSRCDAVIQMPARSLAQDLIATVEAWCLYR